MCFRCGNVRGDWLLEQGLMIVATLLITRSAISARLAGESGPVVQSGAHTLSGREPGWETDDLFIYLSASQDKKHRGDLLGGVSALQETDLTGPISIYKVLPKVVMRARFAPPQA